MLSREGIGQICTIHIDKYYLVYNIQLGWPNKKRYKGKFTFHGLLLHLYTYIYIEILIFMITAILVLLKSWHKPSPGTHISPHESQHPWPTV